MSTLVFSGLLLVREQDASNPASGFMNACMYRYVKVYSQTNAEEEAHGHPRTLLLVSSIFIINFAHVALGQTHRFSFDHHLKSPTRLANNQSKGELATLGKSIEREKIKKRTHYRLAATGTIAPHHKPQF